MPHDIRVATGLESRTNQLTRECFTWLNGPVSDRCRAEAWDGREPLLAMFDVLGEMCLDFGISKEKAIEIIGARMKMRREYRGNESMSKLVMPNGRPLGSTEGF